MSLFSWQRSDDLDLEDVLNQEIDICWAISIIRQFIALLKLRAYVYEKLSIQCLVNGISRQYLTPKGAIDRLEHAGDFLMEEGTVLDSVCPLTYQLDSTNEHIFDEIKFRLSSFEVHTPNSYVNQTDFEDALKRQLASSPVVASIPAFDSYNLFGESRVYLPTQTELDDYFSGKRVLDFHSMLLTGYGTDDNGIDYWEFQESRGIHWGDCGYIKIARGLGVVLNFVEMTVEPLCLSDMDIDG